MIMAAFNRDRYRKKLQELLARAPDEEFFQMIWAMDALQTDRVEAASRYIQFPDEAATSDINSKFAIHPWELETLVGQLLITRKLRPRNGPTRILNCAVFGAAAQAVNHLRKLENEEAGIYLKRVPILSEMPRIGHREFPWQQGYVNVPQFYSYAYIYGQGQCAEYFEHTFGLTIHKFALIGFGLFVSFQTHPFLKRQFSMEEQGITPAEMDAALALLSTPIAQARRQTASMIVSFPIAYQPSILRRFPIVTFGSSGERLRAPLPQLIPLRVTSSVYYDLIKGSSNLRNEASDRFEQYSVEYIAAMMRRFDLCRSYKYKFRGNVIDAPDILIRDGGKIVIAVECKATKLTFDAQFADDPAAQAKTAHDEIAKGVFQLWRYFSHVRRGVVADVVSSSAMGMVLTLDVWRVSTELHEELLGRAAVLTEGDRDITAEDRRTVLFCPIQDLETTIANSDEDSFLRVVAAAGEDRFRGWLLPNVCRETKNDIAESKPFPFQLDDVLPWTEELKRKSGQGDQPI